MCRIGLALVALWLLVPAAVADEANEPLSISRIMKLAHLTPGNRGTRDNLDRKVIDGKATREETEKLLGLYQALHAARPPKGSLEDWKRDTAAMVAGVQAVLDAKEGGREQLAKSIDCKACHQRHRSFE